MNQDNNHDNMMMAIGQLQGQVSEGFKGVHQRQDNTNGQLKKHEDRINILEKSQDRADGLKMSWREILGWVTGVGGVAIAVASLWLK